MSYSQGQASDMMKAYGLGMIGVVVFSCTLAATKVAINQGMSPVFVALTRIFIASTVASVFLFSKQISLPKPDTWYRLLLVVFGVVIGFPLFSALALEKGTAASASIVSGILPFVTAIFSTIATGQKQSPLFWLASIVASISVTIYMVHLHGMVIDTSTVLMLLAVLCGGVGYAFGGQLTKSMPGWQVISWALIPAGIIVAIILMIYSGMGHNLPLHYSWQAWMAIGYVALFSQYIGFFFWYEGLAKGGIAKVSQLQSFQTLFSLAVATLLVGENIDDGSIWVSLLLMACIYISIKSKR